MRRSVVVVLGCAGALGCGTTRYARDGGHVGAVAVHAVEWNAQKVDVGPVSHVVESEGDLVVFGDRGASIFTAGALVAVDHSATRWRGATTIPAADGNGRWIVAIDGEGKLRRLRNGSTFEPIGERYGFVSDRLTAVADFGRGFVGFLGDPSLAAIADGKTVTRFDVAFTALAGGGGKGAAMTSAAVRLFDLVDEHDRVFALEGPRFVAVDPHGRLYAATDREVYEESPSGELSLRYETKETKIHGLVASQDLIWFADGGDLGVIDPGAELPAHVSVTRNLRLSHDARLEPSGSRDVWAIASGALLRFALGPNAAPLAAPMTDAERAARWPSMIQPIFARACTPCHLPDGEANADLSTLEAWKSRGKEIRRRVIMKKAMPPKGHSISDADRAAIEEWTR